MRSKRIQLVAHHAEQKEQKAAKAFAEAQAAVEAAIQQFTLLQGYRHEYGGQRVQTDVANLTAHTLKNYQSFLENLGQTIEQADLEIETKKQQCEYHRQAWLACRVRRKALDSVVDKYQLEEFLALEKTEQKEQDEHSQFQSFKNSQKTPR